MSYETTYTFVGDGNHAPYGRYCVGSSYKCVKDDSLLDTQLLVIDEDGCMYWEDYSNFLPDLTPYLVNVEYEIILDLHGDIRHYIERMVWYEEKSVDELIQQLNERWQKRVHHTVRVIHVEKVG